MTVESQIQRCSENYKMWKERSLVINDIHEVRRAMERAFFWLELRSAFLFLNVIEKTKGNDEETKDKLIRAKISLTKKLTEEAKKMMNEIQSK